MGNLKAARSASDGHSRQDQRRRAGAVGAAVGVLVALPLASAAAQVATDVATDIATDGSLGPALPFSGAHVVIDAALGQQAGPNLFHSFERFSVGTGGSATFTGPGTVGRVIGRVTGGTASTIDGTLAVAIPNADLYLMNPAGMVMGPNATLDMTGALHLSTADRLEFEDGAVFEADPAAASSLTVADPAAFGFLGDNPADLVATGATLAVPAGETISLSGGTVTLTDTTLDAGADAGVGAGAIVVTATGGAGRAALDSTAPPPPGPKPAGAVRVFSSVPYAGALVATTTEDVAPGGAIAIRGGAITIKGAFVAASSGSAAAAGTVEIDAGGDVLITEGAAVESVAAGSGPGGTVTIATPGTVRIAGGDSWVGAFGFDSGAAGDTHIKSGVLEVADGAGLGASAYGFGAGGRVMVETGSLRVDESGWISVGSQGSGAAGSVDITATGPVTLTGYGSTIDAVARYDGAAGRVTVTAGSVEVTDDATIGATAYGAGAAGTVTLSAGTIRVADEAVVQADSHGVGPAGTVSLTATDGVTVEGGGTLFLPTYGTGTGGALTIEAGRITLNGGLIVADAIGSGQGSDVTLSATDTLLLTGESHIGGTSFNVGGGLGLGESGSVTLRAEYVIARDDSVIMTTGGSNSLGGGHILIEAGDTVDLGGNAQVLSETTGSGTSGTITTRARVVRVADAARVRTNTYGTGDAGDIIIETDRLTFLGGGIQTDAYAMGGSPGTISIVATDAVELDGPATLLSAYTINGVNPGGINVEADTVCVTDGAQINSATYGIGPGGDIVIRAHDAVVVSGHGTGLWGSQQRANINALTTGTGNAGRVEIHGRSVTVADGGQVNTGTFGFATGAGGDILIVADDTLTVEGRVSETLRAEVTAGSETLAVAGDIDIRAASVRVLDGAAILTEAASAGGGRITVESDGLVYLGDGQVTTSVRTGFGGGGDIAISDPDAIVLNDGRIQANAYAGDGGNITIVTDLVLSDPDSVIEASSQLGIDGEITIAAPAVDISGAVALPGGLIDAGPLRRDVCGAAGGGGSGSAAAGSSFVVAGRGALPPDTTGLVPARLSPAGTPTAAGPGDWRIDCADP